MIPTERSIVANTHNSWVAEICIGLSCNGRARASVICDNVVQYKCMSLSSLTMIFLIFPVMFKCVFSVIVVATFVLFVIFHLILCHRFHLLYIFLVICYMDALSFVLPVICLLNTVGVNPLIFKYSTTFDLFTFFLGAGSVSCILGCVLT